MTDHNNTPTSSQQRNSADEHCYQTTFNTATDAVTEELIDAVATLNDTAPDELAVLANFIDPDALDALFESRSDGTPRVTNGQVRFRYDEYTVQIKAEGTITFYQSSLSSEN